MAVNSEKVDAAFAKLFKVLGQRIISPALAQAVTASVYTEHAGDAETAGIFFDHSMALARLGIETETFDALEAYGIGGTALIKARAALMPERTG